MDFADNFLSGAPAGLRMPLLWLIAVAMFLFGTVFTTAHCRAKGVRGFVFRGWLAEMDYALLFLTGFYIYAVIGLDFFKTQPNKEIIILLVVMVIVAILSALYLLDGRCRNSDTFRIGYLFAMLRNSWVLLSALLLASCFDILG